MNKAYDKVVWQNTPSTASPLNATNLNKMSDALDTIDDRVIALDTNKANASDVTTALAGKVDKVDGKGLSANDFTDTLKTKLVGVETGAEVNVQSNFEETDTSSDAYIVNNPFSVVNGKLNYTWME